MNRLLRSGGRGVYWFVVHLGAALLMVCLVASIFDVVNRIFIGTSLPWSHELSVWAIEGVAFVLCGVITLERAHISVSFLFDRIKGVAHTILDLIFTLLAVGFSGMVLYGGLEEMAFTIRIGVTSQIGMWYIPRSIVVFESLVLGGFFMTAFAIVAFIQESKALKSPESEK